MIRLTELLVEHGNKERRVSLTKLEVLMEKMLPEFKKSEATKLTELCAEVHQIVQDLNKLPYNLWNAYPEWLVLKATFIGKLMEVKIEAQKLHSEKCDCTAFIKALDELIAD